MTGAKLARPPNKSVSPPNAVKLVSALSAPGLASNCANGNADAKGFGVDVDSESPTPDESADDVSVNALLNGVLSLSCRFAFWSSTLWKKEKGYDVRY